jgi:hypothetical protein
VSGLLVKVPRHEFIYTGAWMSCCDGLQCSLEIGVGFDAVELTGLDEGRDARPSSAPFVIAREQRVLPVEGD